ncbi:hypothetical protein RB12046 [Rhodopirellula baltica SH 1]|uniref:Uncharacterized protein n=1 Tax=Rhodopirellula baltica (strain DSM 10527 / NCIMB 13988 / SH1) TaxID=243090 RepID=Q7UJ93_RHOBA|nr:hypothetical protein RB12046 [Rhodopirellula baltica SH 1]
MGPCIAHMVVNEGNTILVLGRVLERPGSGSTGSLIARLTLRVIRFPPWTLF